MTISLGADHGAFELKNVIKEYLEQKGIKVLDCGTNSKESVDYPDFAYKACKYVIENRADFAILFCTTGIGMSICANKIKGIKASLVVNEEVAELTRLHNNSNVLVLGRKLVSDELAKKIVDKYLSTPFSNEIRHINRLKKIEEIEDNNYGN